MIRDGVTVFNEDQMVQGSEAWLSLRLGVLTGSRCAPVLVDESKKKSEGRANLLIELVIEQVTGRSPKKDISTPSMMQGLDREPDGIRRFESENFTIVRRVGFCYWVGKYAGCSPDGVIGDFDALVSIKCRELKAHYEFMRRGTVDAQARRQMMHEMWVTGCRQHHYVSYNPDFPRALQYGHTPFTWADLDVDAYERAAETFLREVGTEVAAMRTITPVLETLEVTRE